MELKELLFGEGFVEVLERGLKQITICRGRRDFTPGEVVEAVCAEGDRFLLTITSCEVYRLSEVPREDVRDDGFRNIFALFVGLGNFYPDLEWTDEVSVIRFKVIARKGVPREEESG